MNQKESNHENSADSNKTSQSVERGGFLGFVLRHKISTFLFLLLIVLFVWSRWEIIQLNKKIDQTKVHYTIKLDSMNMDRLQLTAKAFSWAIRSELLRDNLEQVNVFFNDFVKHPDIPKLQYISAADSTILISTNKKEHGLRIDPGVAGITEQRTQVDSASIRIATPIMGLNNKLGVFVMEVDRE